MPTENHISFSLTPEEEQQLNASFETMHSILSPKLIALNAEQRRSIPKMSDKSIPFVEKVFKYCDTDPQFALPYMDINAFRKDMDAVKTLKQLYNPLNQLISNMDDTIMLSGSEAYLFALAYYNSVKLATRMSVPDAKVIYDDLRVRYPR